MVEKTNDTDTSNGDENLEQDDNNQIAAESSNDAEDSTNEGAKNEPTSMLEAVSQALEGAEDPGTEASPTSEDSGDYADSGDDEAKDKTDTEGKDGEGDKDGDKEKDPPFHKHPRWQQMIADRDAYKTKADAFDQFTTTVEEAGLSDQEVDAGFNIMRLMKTDPGKAYEHLKPYMASLSQFVGDALPQDLQGMVDAGRIDAELASNYAKERAQNQWNQGQVHLTKQQSQQQEQARQTAAATTLQQGITDAINTWEQKWSESDTAFSRKQRIVRNELASMVKSQGMPSSPDAAIQMAEAARAIVNEYESQLAPAQKPIKKNFVGGGSSSGPNKSKPKSMLEAIS